jgi:ABC-type nitrate/sulfonate/bicarbonate transport system substrate-binding protein
VTKLAEDVVAAELSRRALLRSAAVGGTALVAGSWLAGCGGSSSSSKPAASASSEALTKAALQLSWTNSVQFGGSYLALKNGLFTKQGLQVSLNPGGPDTAVEPQVQNGKALVGVGSAEGTARAVKEGADFVILGKGYQKNPLTLMSLTKSNITKPEDLIGKKIGASTGDVPALKAFCNLAKLDYSKLTVIPTQYDPAPVIDGKVDAIMCFAIDLPVAAAQKGADVYSMELADFGFTVMSQTYIVRKSTLKEKREEIVKLLRAEFQGWQAFKADPDGAAQVTVDMFPDLGLDLATQKAAAKVEVSLQFSDLTDQHGYAWFTDDEVQSNIKVLKLLGVDATADLWDSSVLQDVYQGKATA